MLIRALQAAAGNFGVTGYAINDSLRFNDNDSAYLSRTPATAGNRKTWTWSGWVKRGNLGEQWLFGVSNDTGNDNYLNFQFSSDDDKPQFSNWTGSINVRPNTTLRDAASWYHLVLKVDTTQPTPSDRVRFYINGTESTDLTISNFPDQNTDLLINTSVNHAVGARLTSGVIGAFDGYLAEINFIDGQALTADDFGQINATTGEWSPIAYSGTYGTNGFYLPFDGNANDDSGNGNNWTENNLASTDYMIDTPTNNFAVFNPLASDEVTLQEGNLEAKLLTTNPRSAITTIPVSSGKWYAEVYYNSNTSDALLSGVVTDSYSPVSGTTKAHRVSSGGGSVGYLFSDGDKFIDNVRTGYGSSATTGDILGIAFNLDDDEITFYKNNVSQGTITTKAFSGGYNFFLSNGTSSGNQVATLNQGADSSFAGNKTRQGNTDANGIGDFYYEPPAGFLALCENNLPTSGVVASGGTETTIIDGGRYYKVHTFTSSGTFTVTSGSGEVEYLVVAGGGSGGGGSGAIGGGGGGAGGYREGSGFSISPASYAVTVGAGGVGATRTQGTNGSSSVFSTITAAGGGSGGSDSVGGTGASGGSGGGGAGRSGVGGAGNTPSTSPSQGNSGGNGTGPNAYAGGAGGGASAVGANGPVAVGGAGTSSSISGTSTFYAGGGGGAGSTYSSSTAGGAGGVGGGGAGTSTSANGGSGTVNTGGGGGASGWNTDSGTSFGGNGGSGIVIIRYTV